MPDPNENAAAIAADAYARAAAKSASAEARGDVDERIYNATVAYYTLSIAVALGGFVWLISSKRR